ncbi:sortase domain-bontaining protein, partial [Umezawaea sp. NPDC059074]|uniref:sortase domain-containing protein n=1 Tax=Umezawaea sp. NPDC059074 TaxID=3346716 RepID=UPI0036906E9C
MSWEMALLTRVLAVVAVGTLGFVAYVVLVGSVRHDRGQDLLYAQVREQLAAIEMPTGGVIEPGTPIAVLEVPGLGLNEVVVEGTAGARLAEGPGHLRTSPLPGQPGVAVLLGRAATFGGPFRDIAALREGDQVVATTGQGRFTYRVDGVRRDGDPLPKAPAAGTGRLLLTSAEGDDVFGLALSPDRTVFVDATLVDRAVAAKAGQPTSLLPEELPLRRDESALVPLVLWLQALLLAVIGFSWARVRWGRVETWFVGA